MYTIYICIQNCIVEYSRIIIIIAEMIVENGGKCEMKDDDVVIEAEWVMMFVILICLVCVEWTFSIIKCLKTRKDISGTSCWLA